MARPLRIEYPGAWYHVMNRGLAKQTIFYDAEYYQLFLNLLAEAHERYQIQIHAFCLMKNHYHLLIHTPLPNLGRVMRHIDGVYTLRSNRLVGRDGPLFRGRYKAILVEADNYLLPLSRYIHLNPCVAKIVNFPEDYPWSSYRFFLHGNKPDWLYCDKTLNYFSKDKIQAYEEFIIAEMGDESSYFKEIDILDIPILATDNFINNIKSEIINLLPRKDIPELKRLLRKFSPNRKEIISFIESYYKAKTGELNDGSHRNKVRDVAIYFCRQLTGSSFRDLTKEFKNMSISCIAKAYKRTDERIKNNSYFKKQIEIIGESLSKIET